MNSMLFNQATCPPSLNPRWTILIAAGMLFVGLNVTTVHGQAGLRDSLERLDRNQDGTLDPDEITPLARPYLERVARARRMSIDRPNGIDKWQEAARAYYALQNGVSGKDIEPEEDVTVKPFGTDPDEPLVPEFGLAEVKYPYNQDDLDFVARTMRSHDENKDGYIDRREASRHEWTHRNPFDDDLDGDGRLSRLEMAQRYARRRLLEGASNELVKKAWRTGNGIRPSTPQEQKRVDSNQYWRRGGTRYYLTATVLGRFDLNKNGRLEASESLRLGIPTGRIDLDRDGELSRDELEAYFLELQDQAGGMPEGLPGWFFELDANRDRQVAMTEFTAEWSQEKLDEFASLDLNEDGLLTESEVLAAKSMVGGSYRNEHAEVLPPRKSIISEIEVSEDYLIGDLNIQFSITHTYTSHLDAFLTGPSGQRIELFTGIGGSDDHFDQTVLDDQSRFPITKARPPFRGTFMPESRVEGQPSLSSFNGTSVKGLWQLVIRCSRSERFGMLHSWSLVVTPQDDMLDEVVPSPGVDGPDPSAVPITSSSAVTSQPDPRVRAAPTARATADQSDRKAAGDEQNIKQAFSRYVEYQERMKREGKEISPEKKAYFEKTFQNIRGKGEREPEVENRKPDEMQKKFLIKPPSK